MTKVFISCSHDTVEHQERVLAFANRLRGGSIDAEIDQYNASPPEGWPLWCERQIKAADFVLMHPGRECGIPKGEFWPNWGRSSHR